MRVDFQLGLSSFYLFTILEWGGLTLRNGRLLLRVGGLVILQVRPVYRDRRLFSLTPAAV